MISIDDPRAHRRADELVVRLVYATTLPAFLLGALAARLTPAPLRRRAGRTGLSVLAEARASARNCGSLALMG